MTDIVPKPVSRASTDSPKRRASASPGSLHVRPRRYDASKDENAFYEVLEWWRVHAKFSRRELGGVLSDLSPSAESNMRRKIRERSFSIDAQHLILEHIFSEDSAHVRTTRARLNNETHALYYTLLNFLQTDATSQDDTRASIIGTYRFWRHSVDHPNEFVLGKLVFSEHPGTRAVTVHMHQTKRSAGGSRKRHSESDGYFFEIGNAYLMLLNDPVNCAFRVTIFPSFQFGWVGIGPGGDGHSDPRSIFASRVPHLVCLDGYVVGIDSNKCFLSPMHMVLVDDVDELATLEDELDVMPQDDARVPPRVRQKLLHSGPLKLLQV